MGVAGRGDPPEDLLNLSKCGGSSFSPVHSAQLGCREKKERKERKERGEGSPEGSGGDAEEEDDDHEDTTDDVVWTTDTSGQIYTADVPQLSGISS